MKLISHAAKFVRNKYVMLAAPAIIINSKKEILLGKRGKNMPFYPGIWGLPGGLTSYGEKLVDSVKREVKEEIGVGCNVIKISKHFYEVFPTKECPIHTLNIPYYCKIKGTPKAKDETSEVRWFKKSEIRKMDLAYTHKEILKKEKLI